MKKVLLLATVEGFFNFEINDIKILQNLGYEVHLASNSEGVEKPIEVEGCIKHQINFARSPYSKNNWSAYKELCKIVSREKFDLIHCHTPVGGVMGRIVGHKFGIKTIYTAHGFHFFEGASLKNWLLFYPVEKFLSRWTDILITINKEDYLIAKKFKPVQVKYVPGVGIDCEKYRSEILVEQKNGFRAEFGLDSKDIVLLSVGELSTRKNHRVVLEAIARLGNSNVKYVICGQGETEKELIKLAEKLGIAHQLKLVGFQKNIKKFMEMADIFIFPSLQEGLPVALMEAMASGLPVIGSKIRGNTDLIENGKNGYLIAGNDAEKYAEKIKYLLECPEKCLQMKINNWKKIQLFDVHIISKEMKMVYQSIEKENENGTTDY